VKSLAMDEAPATDNSGNATPAPVAPAPGAPPGNPPSPANPPPANDSERQKAIEMFKNG
jgi:hypothetical protein